MHKIKYDSEVKILTITLRKGKITDSEIKGNIVLDYDNKGELLTLDVMDVNLEDLIRDSAPKKHAIKA
jgi:uncharacterized protein YuzE